MTAAASPAATVASFPCGGSASETDAVIIRPAGPRDLEALLAIQRDACVAAFPHIYPPELFPFPDDEVRNVWRASLEDDDVDAYVSEVDGESVGSVSVGGDFLRTLYVLPGHWRSGVGSALHDHALERLRSRGVTLARLWTLEGNDQGRRFYEHRGWRLNENTRVVPFPPNPIDVQYEKAI
jgi:GNAT superfamily N-acetyltransferase